MTFFEKRFEKSFKQSLLVLAVLLLSACAKSPYYAQQQVYSSSQFNQLPNWYHDELGFQLAGNNAYPEQPALASLLKQADTAFMQLDLDACQIFLERAQRISSRDASVYVRLSYLYWLQKNKPLATQTARRALAVVGNDEQSRIEIQRLIVAINQN